MSKSKLAKKNKVYLRPRGSKWSYRFIVKVDGKRKEIGKGGYATEDLAEIGYLETYEPEQLKSHSKFQVYTYCKTIFLMRNSKSIANDKTTKGNIQILENHIKNDAFGSMHIKQVTAKKIDEFYERLSRGQILKRSGKIEPCDPVSNTTIRRINRTINIPFNHAFLYGELGHANPLNIITLPKTTPKVYGKLTQEDVNKLFEELEKTDEFIVRAFIMLSALSGLRRGEIVALEWDSIDFDRKIIRVRRNMSKQPTDYARIPIPSGKKNVYVLKTTKTERERNYPMDRKTEEIFLALKDYHEKLKAKHPTWETMVKLYTMNQDKRLDAPRSCNLVFRWENGDYMRPDYMTKRHKAIMQAIFGDNDIRLHDERHSCAKKMLLALEQNDGLQTLLGHSRISTTIDQYGSLDGEDCRSSVERYSKRFDLSPKKSKADDQ